MNYLTIRLKMNEPAVVLEELAVVLDNSGDNEYLLALSAKNDLNRVLRETLSVGTFAHV